MSTPQPKPERLWSDGISFTTVQKYGNADFVEYIRADLARNEVLQEGRLQGYREALMVCGVQGDRYDCGDKAHDDRWCPTCEAMSDGADRCHHAIEQLIKNSPALKSPLPEEKTP